MVKSPVNYSHRAQGLTLIEVLIALAIIGIALTAVIKATSQSVRHTAYLQNKTIALWVGQEVINEARAHVLKLPANEHYSATKKMLGQTWYVKAEQDETPNKNIKLLTVKVFDREDEEENAVITLESYLNHDA